ncbi:MBL fold metallo-hydrolase [Scopulibacillus cellulosilyticus]|uniref:MBL fold metallo-hydrolase n=1 Tax=Scopulibacillus cellulosilyticus TaxID=2665665 RepID=A0ABW2PXU8_9BACL
MLDDLGIIPVKIDLPFRLNHVNCFLAEGSGGWTVIDTGLHNKKTAELWDEQLKGKRVTDIIITHYHPDHYGYAGGLQRKTGAQVSMSEIDARDGSASWEKGSIRNIQENYALCGIPYETAQQMIGNTQGFYKSITPYPEVNHYLQEGEKIPFGLFEYEVIFTPGHSDGLVTFYNKDKNVLLSTDHILPKITPNIAYWFHGDENPLASYLNSLKKVRKLNADFVIPSHGQPFYGANDRIDKIIQHHDARLEKTLDCIKNGATIFEACQGLFRRDLNIHETRFALGETLAHLEYLRYDKQCQREILSGKWWYFL